MTRISIVTPTFNSQRTVQATIDSVQQQTEAARHIIIDGVSRDETVAICQRALRESDTLISERDHGIYDAMNRGIRRCTTEIVGILNSDDAYAHPHVLESVLDAFTPEIDIVYGDIQYRRTDGSLGAIWRAGVCEDHGGFSRGWHPPHPAFFVRRVCYERYGLYDTSLRVAADFELMLRFFDVARLRSRYVPDVLVIMAEGGNSGTWRGRMNGLRDIRTACRRHGMAVGVRFLTTRYLPKVIR